MAVGGPTHSRPAQWVVTQRIRGRFGASSKPCPADFVVVYVKIGRLACEQHYSVGDNTVTRWLDECGKERLIAVRATHVRQLRSWARRSQAAQESRSQAQRDYRFVDPDVAQAAAEYLRINANGGWMVSPTDEGDWRVGIARKSSAQLVDMARRNGFDVATATLSDRDGFGVGSG